MKYLILVPDQWQCKLEECPPGFFVYEDELCFKSEYSDVCYFCSSGEFFMPREVDVQPVSPEWKEE